MSRGAALVAALGLMLTGCGEDRPDTMVDELASQLRVTLDADGPGGEPERTAVIGCQIADGLEECPAALESISRADFEPVAPDTPCTEIYGGPDTVAIEGALGGERVEAELTRANGCEIERFERFTPLLRRLFPGYEPGASLGA